MSSTVSSGVPVGTCVIMSTKYSMATSFAGFEGVVGGDVSASGALTAVDVQNIPGDERGVLHVDDGVHDIPDLADPAERVKRGERVVRLGCVHRGADDAQCDGVDPDAAVRVLDCQCLGDSVEPTLGQ